MHANTCQLASKKYYECPLPRLGHCGEKPKQGAFTSMGSIFRKVTTLGPASTQYTKTMNTSPINTVFYPIDGYQTVQERNSKQIVALSMLSRLDREPVSGDLWL